MGKRENQGQDNNQGWEKEKTQGLVTNKVGNSITSPNKNPGSCIRQLRVHSPAVQGVPVKNNNTVILSDQIKIL